jgi:hypothetical protein
MWLHRLECTRACDLCAPTMRPLPSRAHAHVRLPVYIANAHVMYIHICTYIDTMSGYVSGYACVLAYACDRVRALTMLEYAARVRVRRALFVRPSIDGTHLHSQCVRARVRVRLGAHASAPTHASTFRRLGPRVVRPAGAPVCVKVQPKSCGVERGPRQLLD